MLTCIFIHSYVYVIITDVLLLEFMVNVIAIFALIRNIFLAITPREEFARRVAPAPILFH